MHRNNNTFITNFDYDRLNEVLNKYIVSNNKRDLASIKKLADELKCAKKVNSKKIPSDVVTMNSIFELKNLGESGKFQFQLVFPDEANLQKGKLSVLAPIGTAVLGYREGDVIKWEVPSGEKYFQITKVLYQPEANGDYHL